MLFVQFRRQPELILKSRCDPCSTQLAQIEQVFSFQLQLLQNRYLEPESSYETNYEIKEGTKYL